MPFLGKIIVECNFYTIFNICYLFDFQLLIKMLQKHHKKNRKKSIIVLKKCLPLQRFN